MKVSEIRKALTRTIPDLYHASSKWSVCRFSSKCDMKHFENLGTNTA